MFEYIFEQVISKINDYTNKKIVIFGTGRGGKILANILKSLSIHIAYFVDNDDSKINKNMGNFDVKNPDILSNENKDNIIILIASMYYDEISSQLNIMGFKENKEYYYILPTKSNESNFEEKDEELRLSPSWIEKYTFFEEFGFSVGKYTYGYQQFFYKKVCLEKIGAFCSIADNVNIARRNHPVEWISTHPFYYLDQIDEVCKGKNKKVIIGNDVWIGRDVTILPSVNIGNGAVIGAGSVVTRDIPDYAIAVGVPAKVMKYRFSREKIKLLNEIKWWEWDEIKLKENIKSFYEPEKFFFLHSK